MWPSTSDFSDWQWDAYVSDDPDQAPSEPVFGWCRIAIRKIDGVIEKVTEWRFMVEHPFLATDTRLRGGAMNHQQAPGVSRLYRLGGLIMLLMILPAIIQILVLELLGWVETVAPWLVLGLLLAAGWAIARRLLHRHYV